MELVVFSLELYYIQLLIGNEKFEEKKLYNCLSWSIQFELFNTARN